MASSKYWSDREADWTKECQANNVQWDQELQDIYQTMNDEISEQIAVFYQKYADENGLTYAQAKQYLDQTDIRYYSRLAKRYCDDAAKDMAAGTWDHDAAKSYFTQQANQDMKRYNTAMRIARLDMLKHQIGLRIANAQRKVCSVVEDALNDRILQTYTRQAGILGDTVLNNLKHVSTIAHASFHGATFSDRIWGTQQAKLKKVLNKALQDCLILGKGAAPFIRELKKTTGKTTRECQRLISTELSRVRVQASLDSFKACGFDEFQIVSSADCCDECQALNEHHFPLPKLASGENAPPMHPNCRCSIAPYEARDDDADFDEASFDEWCDYMEEHEDDPDALTWEEWKDKGIGKYGSSNDSEATWPDGGKKISTDEYKKMRDFASQQGFKLSNLKDFDGDQGLFEQMVQTASKVRQVFPGIFSGKKQVKLNCSYYLGDDDFAVTNGHIITINGKTLRSKEELDEYYGQSSDEGWFVKGTDYNSVLIHELGHVHWYTHGQYDCLEIAQKILGMDNQQDTLDWIEENLSKYAGGATDGSEIVSEVFSDYFNSKQPTEFSKAFIEAIQQL